MVNCGQDQAIRNTHTPITERYVHREFAGRDPSPNRAFRPSVLPLAAVVAQHWPAVRAFDKRVIARLFRGNTTLGFTPNTKISVDAEYVICRVSNVDITSRSCELNFGARKRTLSGRDANEVGATMAAAGIPPREPRARGSKASPNCAARSTRRNHAEDGRRRAVQFRNGAVTARLLHSRRRAGHEAFARGVAGPVTKPAMTAANFERSEGNSIRQ